MDIKISSFDKLIEMLPNAVGRLFKAYFDRKDADTKAYEMRKTGEAEAYRIKLIQEALTPGTEYKSDGLTLIPSKELPQGIQQKALPEPSIEERTLSRLTHQEIKKQHNLESVVAFAAEELKDKEPVTDTPVDDDWGTRFFRIAEDVSNEQMQFYWGRILAGEITRPGSFSLRTLDIFRNISKEEAEVFAKVANFAFKVDGSYSLPRITSKGDILEAFGVPYPDIATLIEIGLILPGDLVNFVITPEKDGKEELILFKNVVMLVYIDPAVPKINIPIYNFTSSGDELLKLIDRKTPFEYIKAFARSIKSNTVKVVYSTDFVVMDDHVQIDEPLKEFDFDDVPPQS